MMEATAGDSEPGGLDDVFLQECETVGLLGQQPVLRDEDALKLVALWRSFQSEYESHGFSNTDKCLETLLISTARIVFSIQYSKQISAASKQELKGIIAECGTKMTDVPYRARLCEGISCIVENPWQAARFKEVTDGTKSKIKDEALWDTEGWIMLETRIEYLTGAGRKGIDRVCSVLHVLVEKGHEIFPQDSNKSSHIQCYQFSYRKYINYLGVYAMLYANKNVQTQIMETWEEQLLLAVISSLVDKATNPESVRDRLFPKLKIWKDVSEIVKDLAKQATLKALMSESAVLLEEFFAIWMKISNCGSNGMEQSEAESPIDEILKQARNISSSENMYRLATIIIQSMGKTTFTRPKYVEIFLGAMTNDMNAIEKLKSVQGDKSEVIETIHRKLSLRFLALAQFFKEFPKTAKQCIITAFSLNPCFGLYYLLFPSEIENRNITTENQDDTIPSEYADLKDITFDQADSEEDLGLDDVLTDDLEMTIMHPRYKGLVGRKSEEELKELCKKLLDSKSVTVIENKQLDHLEVDYDKYKDLKPQYDPDDDGIEKGYRYGERLRRKTVLHSKNRNLLTGSSIQKARKNAFNRVRKFPLKSSTVRKGRPPKNRTNMSGYNGGSVSRDNRHFEEFRQMPNICLPFNPWCGKDVPGGFFREFYNTCLKSDEPLNKEKSFGRNLTREANLSSLVQIQEPCLQREDCQEPIPGTSSHTGLNEAASSEPATLRPGNRDLSSNSLRPTSSHIGKSGETLQAKFKRLGIQFPKEIPNPGESFSVLMREGGPYYKDLSGGLLENIFFQFHNQVADRRKPETNLPSTSKPQARPNRQLKSLKIENASRKTSSEQKTDIRQRQYKSRSIRKLRGYSEAAIVQKVEQVTTDLDDDDISKENDSSGINGSTSQSDQSLTPAQEIINAAESVPLPEPTPPPKPEPVFAGAFQIMGTYTKAENSENQVVVPLPSPSPNPGQINGLISNIMTPTRLEQLHKREPTVNNVQPDVRNVVTQSKPTPMQDAPCIAVPNIKISTSDRTNPPVKTYPPKSKRPRRLVITNSAMKYDRMEDYISAVPKTVTTNDVPDPLNHPNSASTSTAVDSVPCLSGFTPKQSLPFDTPASCAKNLSILDSSHNLSLIQNNVSSHMLHSEDNERMDIEMKPQMSESRKSTDSEIFVTYSDQNISHGLGSKEKEMCMDFNVNEPSSQPVCIDSVQINQEKLVQIVHQKSDENLLNESNSSSSIQPMAIPVQCDTVTVVEVRNTISTTRLSGKEGPRNDLDEKSNCVPEMTNEGLNSITIQLSPLDKGMHDLDEANMDIQPTTNVNDKEAMHNPIEKNKQLNELVQVQTTKHHDDTESPHIDNVSVSNCNLQSNENMGLSKPAEDSKQMGAYGLAGENNSIVHATKTAGIIKLEQIDQLQALRAIITGKKPGQGGDPKCAKDVSNQQRKSTPVPPPSCNNSPDEEKNKPECKNQLEGTECHDNTGSSSLDVNAHDEDKIFEENAASTSKNAVASTAIHQSKEDISNSRSEGVETNQSTTDKFSVTVNNEVDNNEVGEIFNQEKIGLMSENQNSTLASFSKSSEESTSNQETGDCGEDIDKECSLDLAAEAQSKENDERVPLKIQGLDSCDPKIDGDMLHLSEKETSSLSIPSESHDDPQLLAKQHSNILQDEPQETCNNERDSAKVMDNNFGIWDSDCGNKLQVCDDQQSRHCDEESDNLSESDIILESTIQNQQLNSEDNLLEPVLDKIENDSVTSFKDHENIQTSEETSAKDGDSMIVPDTHILPEDLYDNMNQFDFSESKDVESQSLVENQPGNTFLDLDNRINDNSDKMCEEEFLSDTTNQHNSIPVSSKNECPDPSTSSKLRHVTSSLLPHGTPDSEGASSRPITPVHELEELINTTLKKKSKRPYEDEEDRIKIAHSVVKHVEQHGGPLRKLLLCFVEIEKLPDEMLPEKSRSLIGIKVKRSTRLKNKKNRPLQMIRSFVSKSTLDPDDESMTDSNPSPSSDLDSDIEILEEILNNPNSTSQNNSLQTKQFFDNSSKSNENGFMHTLPQVQKQTAKRGKPFGKRKRATPLEVDSFRNDSLLKMSNKRQKNGRINSPGNGLSNLVKGISSSKAFNSVGNLGHRSHKLSNSIPLSGSSTEVEDDDQTHDLDSVSAVCNNIHDYTMDNNMQASPDNGEVCFSEDEKDPLALGEDEVLNSHRHPNRVIENEIPAVILLDCSSGEDDGDYGANVSKQIYREDRKRASVTQQSNLMIPADSSTNRKNVTGYSERNLDAGIAKENLVENYDSDSSDIIIIQDVGNLPIHRRSETGVVSKNHVPLVSCGAQLESGKTNSRNTSKSSCRSTRLKTDQSTNNPIPSLSTDQNCTISEKFPALAEWNESFQVTKNLSSSPTNEERNSNMAAVTDLSKEMQDNDGLPNTNVDMYILPDNLEHQYENENDERIERLELEQTDCLKLSETVIGHETATEATHYHPSANTGDQATMLLEDNNQENVLVKDLEVDGSLFNQETSVRILDASIQVCCNNEKLSPELNQASSNETREGNLTHANTVGQDRTNDIIESAYLGENSQTIVKGIVETNQRHFPDTIGQSETVASVDDENTFDSVVMNSDSNDSRKNMMMNTESESSTVINVEDNTGIKCTENVQMMETDAPMPVIECPNIIESANSQETLSENFTDNNSEASNEDGKTVTVADDELMQDEDQVVTLNALLEMYVDVDIQPVPDVTNGVEMSVENGTQQTISSNENEDEVVLSTFPPTVTIDANVLQLEQDLPYVTPIDDNVQEMMIADPESPLDTSSATDCVGEGTQNKENSKHVMINEDSLHSGESDCAEMTVSTAGCSNIEESSMEGGICGTEDTASCPFSVANNENEHENKEDTSQSPENLIEQPGSPKIPILTPERSEYDGSWQSDDEPPLLEMEVE